MRGHGLSCDEVLAYEVNGELRGELIQSVRVRLLFTSIINQEPYKPPCLLRDYQEVNRF